jgi:hypothetical protein
VDRFSRSRNIRLLRIKLMWVTLPSPYSNSPKNARGSEYNHAITSSSNLFTASFKAPRSKVLQVSHIKFNIPLYLTENFPSLLIVQIHEKCVGNNDPHLRLIEYNTLTLGMGCKSIDSNLWTSVVILLRCWCALVFYFILCGSMLNGVRPPVKELRSPVGVAYIITLLIVVKRTSDGNRNDQTTTVDKPELNITLPVI